MLSTEPITSIHSKGVKFITRVPETIKEAKQAIAETDLEALQPLMKTDG